MSGARISCPTERFGALELSGQRDFDPNQVECFLRGQNDVESDSGSKLLCQICKLNFDGPLSSHRLLEHVHSIHSFNIYDKEGEIHRNSCESESKSSLMGEIDEKKREMRSDSKKHPEFEFKAVKVEIEDDQESESLDLTIRKASPNRKERENNSLKCYICSKVFNWTREFRSHLINSHGDELNDKDIDDLFYRCKKCAATFPNLILLRGHFFNKHVTFIVYRCLVCHVISKSKKTLKIHFNSYHAQKSSGPHFCHDCGKEVTSLKALRTHIRVKHGELKNKQGFRCRLCQQKFDSKENRKLHYEENHLGESLFMCKDCGKGFSSKSGLYGHRQLHKKDQPSACPYCEKIFSRRDSYHEHILIHVGPRHRCPHCPKEFVQRSNLVRHIRIHTGQKPYTCTYCDKRFSDKGACNSHIRVHTKEEQCTCPYCGQTFTKKQKLKYHIRKHTGEGLISCEICSKTFTNAFALKEHRAIHDRQTQTICVECGKAFNSEKYLQRHIALVHQDVQDSRNAVNCPVCEKTFYHQTRLKSHLVTHLGKKHLQCLICEKRYSSPKSMRNHMKQRHDLTPDHPEYAESIRSKIANTQKSVDSMQLAEDSRSSEANIFTNKEITGVVLKNGEDSGDSSSTRDKKSSISSSGDEEAAASMKKKLRHNLRKLVKPKEEYEFIDINGPNVSSEYGNTDGDGSLRIKTENMLEYEHCEVEPGTGLNSAAANETNEILQNIKEEIVDPLYEGFNEIEDKQSSPMQPQENSGAIIEDRIRTDEEPIEGEIGDNCREIVSELKDITDKRSRSESESSKDISRRRKQLRTPKKYVSPVVSLCRIDDKLKNVLPKRERVEAIARSLKNSTTLKKELC